MKNPFKRNNNNSDTSGAFHVGDTVRVKDGTHYPDVPEIDISGWQGRITDLSEINDDPPTIGFAWDSIALRSLPAWLIEQYSEEGYEWPEMYLAVTDLEHAPPRDSADETMHTLSELQDQYRWSFLGEEGQRVNAVLAGITDSDEQFEAWKRYLETMLKFPFEAKVVEFQEGGYLNSGDILKVLNIEFVDDLYGIIVRCRRRRRELDAALGDLEVTNRQSVNYQPVQDYVMWFANR